jgi:hypothetical protein
MMAVAFTMLVSLPAWSQTATATPPPQPTEDERGYPDKPAMLEYVVRRGAETCPSIADFLVEVAIARDGRREQEFLPHDPADRDHALVRLTLERLAGGKLQGTLEHRPALGQPQRAPVVMVNSECEDLLEDLAFPASFYLPRIVRPTCEPPANGPTSPAPGPTAPRTLPAPPTPSPPAAPGCDPDAEGDAANDERCERLLGRLEKKYGRPVEFWLLGGGLMTLAYTSDPGPGVLIGATVQGRRWSVGIEAQATLPAPVRVSPMYDADVSTFVGLIVPCVRLGEAVRFVGCGVVGGGLYLSHDSEAPEPQVSLLAPTIRIGPRAGVEVPVGGRFTFFAWGEVSFAPIYQVLNYEPPPVSWSQSAASVFLSAGFSVRLGGQTEK